MFLVELALASSWRLTVLVRPARRMNLLRFTGTCPATACSALRTCSSIPRSVRRARSYRYR